METLPDVVARERRSGSTALVTARGRRQLYTYDRFCTTAWKTGNFLRHLGVRDGVRVAIADEPAAQTLLTLFGSALLEGVSWIGAPQDADARAVVAPVGSVESYDLPDGGQYAGYGGEPTEASTYHFEEQVWSENPARVPTEYDPDAPVLTNGEREYSHSALLAAARETVDRHGLEDSDAVAVPGSLAAPGVVAAGVLAPLLVGGTVLLGHTGEDREPALVVDEESAPDVS